MTDFQQMVAAVTEGEYSGEPEEGEASNSTSSRLNGSMVGWL